MLAFPLLFQLANPALANPVLTVGALNLGRVVQLQVTGGAANQLVYFTVSTTGQGAGPCIGATGVCADILNPIIIGQTHTDANGYAWVYVALSPDNVAAGTDLWFQAFPRVGRTYSETQVVSGTVVQPAYVRCYDPGVDAPVLRVPRVTITTFENHPLYYYMPANPRGVIFYFHGSDDGPSEVLNTEQVALLFNQMGVNENFGVVATERTATAPGQAWDWSTPAGTNQDALRMNRLRNWLVSNTGMTNTTPVVLTGFSDGAGFATSFSNYATGYGWPVVLTTPHNGAFGNTPDVPSAWEIAANDDANATQGIGNLTSDMQRAGLAYLQTNTPERLVTASTFLREPTWDLTDGQDLVNDMVAYGLIDANGRRLVPDNQIESQINGWEAQSTLPTALQGSVRLRVLWATHRYSAYDNQTECDFIRDRIP